MDNRLAKLVTHAEGVLTQSWDSAVQLGDAERLTESGRRNLLVRCKVLEGPADAPGTVMIKRARAHKYDPDNPKSRSAVGLFRDWAGLEFLSKIDDGQLISPAFYGGDREARFFVMEDLGPTVDVDSVLTQRNAHEASQTLVMLAETLGRMHALSAGRQEEYQKIRDALGPGDGGHRNRLARHARQYAPALADRLEYLGVTASPSFADDIEDLAMVMANPGPFLAYTHADPCPDNVILSGDRVRLFDHEFGNFRHALLDGVFGRFRFPTCWCVRDIPDEVVTELESVYRRELIKGCPQAGDDSLYFRAIAEGCGYWMLENLASLFDRALKYEEPKGTSTNRQRILIRLAAFCEVAQRADHLLGMKETFERLLEFLRGRWADNMPLYDAFSQHATLSDQDTRAMIEAVRSSDVERASELLDREPGLANAKAFDADQTPALYLAVQTKNADLVTLLLEKGADPQIMTRTGWTVLGRACLDSTPEIVDSLLEHGADLNQRDMWGQLPMYGAVTAVNPTMFQHLLNRGALPDLKTAIDLKQPDLARRLLDKNPSLARRRFGTGTTLLHDSARVGDSRVDIMKLLLEHGADVNAKTNWDATPLHLAAFNGNQATVRLLLEHGADPEAKDHRNYTPFQLARGKGHTLCADLLNPLDKAGDEEASLEEMSGEEAIVNSTSGEQASSEVKKTAELSSFLGFSSDPGSIEIMDIGELYTGTSDKGSGSLWLEEYEPPEDQDD